MKVAVVGAGWAGCAAAVESMRLGHQATLFETARTAGGRARRVAATVSGQPVTLDNGQHILIGAYSETLRLMTELGIDVEASLLRLPLTLQSFDGSGIKLPRLPAPLDAFTGILTARGWSWADKHSLLKVAIGWQLRGFKCGTGESVTDLSKALTPGVIASLIEPLCVSALNTPPERASGQVFLRVLRDALFSKSGGSNLLLPRVDLSTLLPDAALAWLAVRGGLTHLGARVHSVTPAASGWRVITDTHTIFDRVILACPPHEAARLVEGSGVAADGWLAQARSLQHEALTTVYAQAPDARLSQPMLLLRPGINEPAQFVFDRGQLGGPAGLLAFVISASLGDSATLTSQVLAQAARQLGLSTPKSVQTIVEKRATFACTPGLQRPAAEVAAGLLACGDYIAGPYPATLEGAVRSGLEAARRGSAKPCPRFI
ncbi:MAG: NAD(P)-binding protein [Polaromonas sp.]|uniref:hydroxysqualene dehydroxylase HpnE n=1 Tax=Polaromonas sp. TaxID=1869339 RepID=UPI00181E8DAE|nr:hydroxysqualene dehydroxylase HpnE [Polaromonas sp.]NMM09169.1 NAD(P)-binding protein [Polaromonas sp.]